MKNYTWGSIQSPQIGFNATATPPFLTKSVTSYQLIKNPLIVTGGNVAWTAHSGTCDSLSLQLQAGFTRTTLSDVIIDDTGSITKTRWTNTCDFFNVNMSLLDFPFATAVNGGLGGPVVHVTPLDFTAGKIALAPGNVIKYFAGGTSTLAAGTSAMSAYLLVTLWGYLFTGEGEFYDAVRDTPDVLWT